MRACKSRGHCLEVLLRSVMLCILGCTISSGLVEVATADDGEGVNVRWAFGALVGSGENRRLQPVTRDITLRTGDQFKMFVELKKRSFVYLLYYNPQDGIRMLFPYTLEQFDTDYQLARRYYIPQGDAWFELDQHIGRENFYLVVSPRRLDGLEALLREYETNDPEKKAELLNLILQEIREIKRHQRELAVPAERPVPIGGAIRGLEKLPLGNSPDVAVIADDLLSTGLIARTFTIEHQ